MVEHAYKRPPALAIATGVCTLWVGITAFYKFTDFFNERVIGLAERKFEASSHVADNVSVFILRSVDDEPHLAFAIGALGNRLVVTVLHITVFFVLLAPLALVLTGFGVIIGEVFFYHDAINDVIGLKFAAFIIFGFTLGHCRASSSSC